MQDFHDHIQAGDARRQTQTGFMVIFGRQRIQFLQRHIGRIADDEVVATAFQRREQID